MQGLSHKRFFFLSVCLFVVNLIFFSSDDKLILLVHFSAALHILTTCSFMCDKCMNITKLLLFYLAEGYHREKSSLSPS